MTFHRRSAFDATESVEEYALSRKETDAVAVMNSCLDCNLVERMFGVPFGR